MKICILTTAFPRWPTDFRGIFVYQAALSLVAKGHSVTVIAMHNPGAKAKETMEGIQVIRPQYAPEKWEILQKDSAGIPGTWAKRPLARLLLIPFFIVHTVSAIRYSKDVDIVHANWTLSGFSAWVSSLFTHKKFVVTVQGSDVFQGAKLAFIRQMTKFVLQKACKVITLSQALAREVVSLGVSPSQIAIIPNGVNIQQFPFSQDSKREPIVLYVGSLIERKGLQYLIQAFPEIIVEHPFTKLVIIGEGIKKEHLEQQVRSLHIGNSVQFLGTQTQEQVGFWMRSSKIFCMPSLEEGQGVVFIEALASGTPCVGTTAGGIPDVITLDVGMLVPPGDSTALASAIKKILSDPVRWEEFSRQAHTRAENTYDWKIIASRLVETYHACKAVLS